MAIISTDEILGKEYGKLTILAELEPKHTKFGNKRIVLCKCSCGNVIETRLDYLRDGSKRSCGCLRWSQKGYGSTKLCKVWRGMHRRCENPSVECYENYGGRGITVCEEWSGENGFMNFREWALNNGYKEGLTIDRIDVNGNYEPSNCRWATYKEQGNNQRSNHRVTYNGETHTISEWADITGLSVHKIGSRINKLHFSIGEALGFEPHEIISGKARKVIQLARDKDVVIAEYKSLIEAAKANGIDYTSISKCCSGRMKTAGNFRWKYA